ncbi:hypothetical protein DUGA6_62800 [Duganella sp. HH105]|nr:hypothetical protein DUGA6_62800 [Duganella sp. HH105]
MHHHHQHMLVGRCAYQANAQQRATLQIERRLVQAHRFVAYPRLQFVRRHGAKIDALKISAGRRLDRLHHLAIIVRAEQRTHGFVSRHQCIEGGLQRARIQLSVQAQPGADVIGRAAWVQLPQKPLAGLRIRRRPAE